jgi:hypothetical protein
MEGGQVVTTVVAVIGSLAGMLVFVIKLIVPWMKSKIDQKNGEIGALVGETRKLAEAILQLVERGNQAQDQFLCALRTELAAEREQVQRLIDLVKEAAERAA